MYRRLSQLQLFVRPGSFSVSLGRSVGVVFPLTFLGFTNASDTNIDTFSYIRHFPLFGFTFFIYTVPPLNTH